MVFGTHLGLTVHLPEKLGWQVEAHDIPPAWHSLGPRSLGLHPSSMLLLCCVVWGKHNLTTSTYSPLKCLITDVIINVIKI